MCCKKYVSSVLRVVLIPAGMYWLAQEPYTRPSPSTPERGGRFYFRGGEPTHVYYVGLPAALGSYCPANEILRLTSPLMSGTNCTRNELISKLGLYAGGVCYSHTRHGYVCPASSALYQASEGRPQRIILIFPSFQSDRVACVTKSFQKTLLQVSKVGEIYLRWPNPPNGFCPHC